MSLFEGLRVIDLSTVLAGPSVGMFFAELGAEVIKIENPTTGGDVTRHWKLPSEQTDLKVSAYFASINYRKQYEFMDLANPSGRDELRKRIASADILITNFKSGDAEKFDLDSQSLRLINPRLIHGRIKGFTSDEVRVAFDVVLQAETGFMYMNGTPQSGPVKMPVALIDVLAAHQLKEGILCALIQRSTTGKGQVVDVSLEQAGMASLVNQASNYLMAGVVPGAAGSLHPNIAPYGETFACSDGRLLVLAVGSDRQFAALCAATGVESLSEDPRFSNNQQRVIHRKALADVLGERFIMRDRDAWMEELVNRKVPAGAIRSMDEVMMNPAAQALIRSETIDGIQTRRLASAVFRISEL